MKVFRKLVIAGASIGALAIAGTALAAWLANGSGSASPVATAHVNSVISPASPGAALYPGANKTFTIAIDNPNDYPSVVTSISTGSSSATGGCDAASVTSDARALDAAGLTQADGSTKIIAPNSTGTYTLASHMIADPKQACESKTFSLSLTATLSSAAS